MKFKSTLESAVIKEIDRTKRQLSLLVSHEIPDGESEVIVQAGMSWARWDRNPQILSQHDRLVPIGTGLPASRRIKLIDGAPATVLTVGLFHEGLSAEADTLYARLKSGATMGVSIGFLPVKYGPPRVSGQRGQTIESAEILEVSLVTLPSCPTCVVLEKSHHGRRFDEPILQLIDADDVVLEIDARDVTALEIVEEELFEIDRREVVGAVAGYCRAAMPAMVRDMVTEGVAKKLRMLRGRVD